VLPQLAYFARLRGASKADALRSANYWIDYFELGEFKNKNLETLSKGNQQKIQIAQSFLNEPDILILDEPFSGLDPVNAQVFKDTIADFVRQGKLVIFSSHQMGYVEEVCDDVTLIHEGDIVLSGSLDRIKREEGRDKLYLSLAQDEGQDELTRALQSAFPGLLVTNSRDGEGLILDTQGQALQDRLLKWLAGQQVTVRRFGLYEPSLTDIFIEKVGETA
jgi:ABC-2 type transport system ATP-binding protein